MLLQHYHILPVIEFYRILAREESIIVKYWIFLNFLRLRDPKLRDLANLWSYKLIMTPSNYVS